MPKLAQKFDAVTCRTCGLVFMLASDLLQLRQSDGRSFSCPNGHTLFFPPPPPTPGSEQAFRLRIRQLEDELDEMRMEISTIKGSAVRDRHRAEQLEAENDGLYDTISARAHGIPAGLDGRLRCPWCDRAFQTIQGLATHARRAHRTPGPHPGSSNSEALPLLTPEAST